MTTLCKFPDKRRWWWLYLKRSNASGVAIVQVGAALGRAVPFWIKEGCSEDIEKERGEIEGERPTKGEEREWGREIGEALWQNLQLLSRALCYSLCDCKLSPRAFFGLDVFASSGIVWMKEKDIASVCLCVCWRIASCGFNLQSFRKRQSPCCKPSLPEILRQGFQSIHFFSSISPFVLELSNGK